MAETVRSDQRLAATIPAVIFGPIFMLGPVIGAVCILFMAQLSLVSVLSAIALCGVGAFITYHMTQNFQWVEFDGAKIRGRKFWTRRLVENTLEDVRDIRVLGAVVKNTVTRGTDAILGEVRGWEIRFHQGPSIFLVKFDMKNAEELVEAVENALRQRGR